MADESPVHDPVTGADAPPVEAAVGADGAAAEAGEAAEENAQEGGDATDAGARGGDGQDTEGATGAVAAAGGSAEGAPGEDGDADAVVDADGDGDQVAEAPAAPAEAADGGAGTDKEGGEESGAAGHEQDGATATEVGADVGAAESLATEGGDAAVNEGSGESGTVEAHAAGHEDGEGGHSADNEGQGGDGDAREEGEEDEDDDDDDDDDDEEEEDEGGAAARTSGETESTISPLSSPPPPAAATAPGPRPAAVRHPSATSRPVPAKKEQPELEQVLPSRVFRLPPRLKSVLRKRTPNTLEMEWAFGLDNTSVGGVHLLTQRNGSENLAYVSGHTLVLHSLAENQQRLLRGHRHSVACTATSGDCRWLVTADAGEDSSLIIWDTPTAAPVRTYFTAAGGCAALDMSADAMFVVSVSATAPQTVSVWDWTSTEREGPLCSTVLRDATSLVTFVRMHRENPRQILLNSASEVFFVEWDFGGSIRSYRPTTEAADMATLGVYTQSVFAVGDDRAFTAGSGRLAVWEESKKRTEKALSKIIEVSSSWILTLDFLPQFSFVVLGCKDGSVRFLDRTLRIIAWTDSLQCGPIASVSFSRDSSFYRPSSMQGLRTQELPKGGNNLDVPDFVVSTANNTVLRVCMRAGEEQQSVLLQGQRGAADEVADKNVAIAAHPVHPHLAMAGRGGLLQIVDVENCLVHVSKKLTAKLPSCLSYSPDGTILAVGFQGGELHLLDSLSLLPLASSTLFSVLSGAVTHIMWSASGECLATADTDRCVALFKVQRGNLEEPWLFVGRNRAHQKTITAVLFGINVDTDAPRLLSVGEDRMLIEYDLATSSFDNGLVLLGARSRVEQTAHPRAMIWHPDTEAESFLLMANDHAKVKLFNSSTKMCRRTVLGPAYDAPIDRLVEVPMAADASDSSPRFVSFSSGANVGLMMLPLTGNPHHYSACVAHPKPIVGLACSSDGKRLFTSGADGSVHVWTISPDSAVAAAKLGGEKLVPFINMLDGGSGGELLRDMEDFFYYTQIRQQGVASHAPYEVSTHVPLTALPDLMRAVGFFPSEEDILNMTNEIKFSEYVVTNKYVTEVDLSTYIRLYVNHRPAFGVHAGMLDRAFAALGGGKAVATADLLQELQRRGEHMTQAELHKCLALLVGDVPGERLHDSFTGASFASDVLGFS